MARTLCVASDSDVEGEGHVRRDLRVQDLGSGRIVASEIGVPIMLVNMV
jgi:hypothetical protein